MNTINKYNENEVFFTSDIHFNHTNILRFCDRPFKSIEEMNETIITNWNRVVGIDDEVFHLGDFCLGGAAEWTKVLDRLNHYPFLCFSGSYKPDVWQLFGHVHTRKNNTGIDAGRLQHLYPTQYDVGVDNNNFTPVSYNQVREIIEKQIHDSKR